VGDDALGEHHPLVRDHDPLDPPEDGLQGEPQHGGEREVEGQVVDQCTRGEVVLRDDQEQQEETGQEQVVGHDRPVHAHPDDPPLGGQQVLVDLARRQHRLRHELRHEVDHGLAGSRQRGPDAPHRHRRPSRLRDHEEHEEHDRERPQDLLAIHQDHRFARSVRQDGARCTGARQPK
jgi:hypothetical protein